MVALWVGLLAVAQAGSSSLGAVYNSYYGPDAWAQIELRTETDAGLLVASSWVGGTRPAALMSVGRALRLERWLRLDATLTAGMLRAGPTGGAEVGIRAQTAALDVVLRAGGVWGLGGYVEGGVDSDLSERTVLSPRLRLGTWAGDRDPGARVGLGLRHSLASGWFASLSGSVGGRDVVHMGPGFALTLGRRQ